MNMTSAAKQVVKSVFDKLGYELRRKPNSNYQIGFNSHYLSRICQPKTVFDVGVGHGTLPLHEAFPKAKFILIEPLREYSDSIEKLAGRYDCDVYYKAVGNKRCASTINIDTDDYQKSSFDARTALTVTGNTIETKTVEVTTLDDIYRQKPDLLKPMLLKIDTEGHELSALQGANLLLQAVDMVIAEVSIAKRFENSYEFEDVIGFMKERGFYVFSFLRMPHPKHEDQPRFTDVVFKRRELHG